MPGRWKSLCSWLCCGVPSVSYRPIGRLSSSQPEGQVVMSQIAFENRASTQGFTVKLWRGERMCLIGFDVTNPEPDFVGFAIECKQPGDHDFHPLLNRLA